MTIGQENNIDIAKCVAASLGLIFHDTADAAATPANTRAQTVETFKEEVETK